MGRVRASVPQFFCFSVETSQMPYVGKTSPMLLRYPALDAGPGWSSKALSCSLDRKGRWCNRKLPLRPCPVLLQYLDSVMLDKIILLAPAAPGACGVRPGEVRCAGNGVAPLAVWRAGTSIAIGVPVHTNGSRDFTLVWKCVALRCWALWFRLCIFVLVGCPAPTCQSGALVRAQVEVWLRKLERKCTNA